MATTPACFRGAETIFYLFTIQERDSFTARHGMVRRENATTCKTTRAVPLTRYTRRSGRPHAFLLLFRMQGRSVPYSTDSTRNTRAAAATTVTTREHDALVSVPEADVLLRGERHLVELTPRERASKPVSIPRCRLDSPFCWNLLLPATENPLFGCHATPSS